MTISRRQFVAGSAMTLAAAGLPKGFAQAVQAKSPFRIAVISDEISNDFEHACSVIGKEFGLQWVELRGMWGKNLQTLTDEEIERARKIMAQYGLRATDIASPLFKTDWPGAPRSKFSPKKPNETFDSFKADFQFKQQEQVLERSIELAKKFDTNVVRCFDFYRLDDVKPYRAAINEKLQQAATTCGQHGIKLVLENEFECNTATGREAAATLAAVKSPHLMLNWDPGNAVRAGELDAFPAAWEMLPKDRIGHCHVKNAAKGPDGKIGWSPVDTGYIDWAAQFRALAKTGYHGAVSLETHWRGAGTAEASTRRSWQGMDKCLREAGVLA